MNSKKMMAVMILILIVCIPFSAAQQVSDYDLSDPEEACLAKNAESSALADALDNQMIRLLEATASIAFTITTTMNAIEDIITTVDMVIGVGTGCCAFPAPVCEANGIKFRAWEEFYSKFQTLSCFVNCGWCTGGCQGLGSIPMDKITLGAIPAVMEPNIEGVDPQGGGGIGQFHISPYDNIYLAMGCLCPVAILFNIRKLKTIYETYDCCIEQACAAGLSTEQCDHFLSTSTCMYWEGSMYKMLVNVALSFISRFLGELIPESWLDPDTEIGGLVNCALIAFRVMQIPGLIDQVKGAFDWMSTSFDKPDCSELGFEKLKPTQQQLSSSLNKTYEDFKDSPNYWRLDMEPNVKADIDIGYFITKSKQEVIDEDFKGEGYRLIEVEEYGGTVVLTADEEDIINTIKGRVGLDAIKLNKEKAWDLMNSMSKEEMEIFMENMNREDLDNLARFGFNQKGITSIGQLEDLQSESGLADGISNEKIRAMTEVMTDYYKSKGINIIQYADFMMKGFSYEDYLRIQRAGHLLNAQRNVEELRIKQKKKEGLEGRIDELNKRLNENPDDTEAKEKLNENKQKVRDINSQIKELKLKKREISDGKVTYDDWINEDKNRLQLLLNEQWRLKELDYNPSDLMASFTPTQQQDIINSVYGDVESQFNLLATLIKYNRGGSASIIKGYFDNARANERIKAGDRKITKSQEQRDFLNALKEFEEERSSDGGSWGDVWDAVKRKGKKAAAKTLSGVEITPEIIDALKESTLTVDAIKKLSRDPYGKLILEIYQSEHSGNYKIIVNGLEYTDNEGKTVKVGSIIDEAIETPLPRKPGTSKNDRFKLANVEIDSRTFQEKIQSLEKLLKKAKDGENVDPGVIRSAEAITQELREELTTKQSELSMKEYQNLESRISESETRVDNLKKELPQGLTSLNPVEDGINSENGFVKFSKSVVPGSYVKVDGKTYRVTDNGRLFTKEGDEVNIFEYKENGNLKEVNLEQSGETLGGVTLKEVPQGVNFIDRIGGGEVGYTYGINPRDPITNLEIRDGKYFSGSDIVPPGSYVKFEGKQYRVSDNGKLVKKNKDGEYEFYEPKDGKLVESSPDTMLGKKNVDEAKHIGLGDKGEFYMNRVKINRIKNNLRSALEDPRVSDSLKAKIKELLKDPTQLIDNYKDVIEEVKKEYVKEMRNKAKRYAIKKAAYEATYQLLSKTLGKWAYEKIEEKCEQDWEASRPETEEPIDVNPAPHDPEEFVSPVCREIPDHSITAQAEKLGRSMYRYSFSITNCDEKMDYRIIFRGPSAERTTNQQSIEKGITKSISSSISDSEAYEEICWEFEKQEYDGIECFPIV